MDRAKTAGFKWARTVVPVLALAGAGLLAGCGGDGETTDEVPQVQNQAAGRVELPPPARRQAAPEFSLASIEGGELSLDDLRGKVVLLNFWATWCMPCRKEIPDFMEMKRDYAGKDFEIVGVSIDREGMAKVAPFAQNAGINYPIVMGNSDIQQAYGGVRSIPTTFVLDKEGRIAARFVGLRPRATFEALTQQLLQEG